jgi:CHASE2 domain-containing sensor protein
LMAQFQQHPNLFTVCGFGSTDRNFAPPPEFSETQRNSQLGFSNLLLDGSMALSSSRDDVSNGEESARAGDSVRRQLLSYDPSLAGSPSACSTPYSFGFQLAYRFLAQAKIQPLQVNQQGNWQFGSVTLQKLPSRFGGYQQLDGMSSQILINYRSSPPGQRVTLKQVLQGQINRSSVENRVVLIGTTAPIARDSFETPYGEMPGTWIHAHMVSQLLSAVMHQRPLIWSLPQWQGVQWGDALWVLAWSAIGSLLAWRVRSWLWLGCATVAAVLVLHQLCLLVLVQGGWLPLVPAGLALVLTGSGSTQAFRRFFLRRQK